MSLIFKQKILLSVVILLPVFIAVSCFLYPPEIRYNSYLTPNLSDMGPQYTLDEDTNSFIFDIGGTSIEVKYMTEAELNALFPDESSQGMYSTNPYTYGNWIDPDLGYTPVRFTTFQVAIINRNFAKMRLDPVEAELITDLGETFHSYTFSVAAARYGNSFEDYYRAVRGQSGNEYYRYEMRLGMVRGKNFGLEEMIFRGDSYSGLLTFDELRPEVSKVQLILNDIVFRFDAFDRPADVTTATFNFERKIERVVVTDEMRQAELEREKVRIRMTGPQQMVNNRINDNARSSMAVDRELETNTGVMEACFIDRYRRAEVDPGRMVISFTIDTSGAIISQNVIEVIGINSSSFMNCILNVIKGLKFEQIEDMPDTGTNIVKGPAENVNVLYPIEFTIYTEE